MQIFVASRVRVSEADFLPDLQLVLFRDRVTDDGAVIVGIFEEFALLKRVRFAVRLRNGVKIFRRRRDDRRTLVVVAASDRNRRFHFRRVARRTHQVVILVRNQPDRVLVVKDRAKNELQFASLGADDQVVPLRALLERLPDDAVNNENRNDERDAERHRERRQRRRQRTVPNAFPSDFPKTHVAASSNKGRSTAATNAGRFQKITKKRARRAKTLPLDAL